MPVSAEGSRGRATPSERNPDFRPREMTRFSRMRNQGSYGAKKTVSREKRPQKARTPSRCGKPFAPLPWRPCSILRTSMPRTTLSMRHFPIRSKLRSLSLGFPWRDVCPSFREMPAERRQGRPSFSAGLANGCEALRQATGREAPAVRKTSSCSQAPHVNGRPPFHPRKFRQSVR